MRIGIDVGGTHTDAVLLNDSEVMASTKALTTADVFGGISAALNNILEQSQVSKNDIRAVMIGTTQFTNAVVERRELSPVAAVRIGLPSGKGLHPMLDWPEDLAMAVGKHSYLLHGGYLYDGWPVANLDQQEIDELIRDLRQKGLKNIVLTSAFSPMNAEPEERIAEHIRDGIPDARITLSHKIGRLGLLERENAAILNASLLPFADRVVDAFQLGLKAQGLDCPMFVSQNDGTLMSAEFVRQFPALTFASGPTNSLRGASFLSGLDNAIVVDIGGTTSDIGVLQGGYPRESNIVIDVGGVRTNFRMPDITAVGLGGGSVVSQDGSMIGPQSVGHRLVHDALVFGGSQLTTTDLIVAAGFAEIGEAKHVTDLSTQTLNKGIARISEILDQHIDMMKPSSDPVPVILVGGGAILVHGDLNCASEIVRPKHAEVANAIGAAIAQIGGEAEQMISYQRVPRDKAIDIVTKEAKALALSAGAKEASLRVADVEETVIPYMDDGNTRIRIKVVGEIGMFTQMGDKQ